MVSIRFWSLTTTVCYLAWVNRAESPYAETRSTLEKWVETRQLISRARADWEASRETLQDNIQVFARELKAVEEQISKLSTNNVQVEKERVDAEAAKKSADEALSRAKQFASDFEGNLKMVLPSFPAPLQEILKPFFLRMPADANSRMTAAERMQVIVGILNEVDKFNNAVSVFNEKRKNAKGEEMAVETLYVGLGGAYFTNETGDFAGTGTPGKSGWEWTAKPEIAPRVREAIQIYRNEKPARFVALPAAVH